MVMQGLGGYNDPFYTFRVWCFTAYAGGGYAAKVRSGAVGAG